MKKNKRGISGEYLIWVAIAIAVLAILMFFIFYLKGEKLDKFVETIKNLFRF